VADVVKFDDAREAAVSEAALVPHAAGIGGYINFMSEYDEDRVRAAYLGV